jgi:DNA-binding NarL/FixJ family response regulator
LGLGFSNVALVAEHADVWERFDAKSDVVATHEPSVEAVVNEATASEVRFLVNDDQLVLRAQLARLLATEARIRVIDQTTDRARGADPTLHLMPAVIADLYALETAARFNLNSPAVQILVVVSDLDDGSHETDGKNGNGHETGREVAGVLAGIRALSAPGSAVDVTRRSGVSNRELVVLTQVAAGLSNKQIGRLLGISQKTVRNHLSRIFGKLDAGNRTEAVMNAMRLGLLTV